MLNIDKKIEIKLLRLGTNIINHIKVELLELLIELEGEQERKRLVQF
jgi:hypothetical protein